MKTTIMSVLTFFFGRSTKERFRRLVELIILCAFIIVLVQNIEFGYNKKQGIYFNWKPAIDKIEIKKGS